MKVVADEGSGPLAVLLHGQPGDGAELLPLRLALRGSGLRVVTVDRPGYDGDPAAATGYAGNARAVAALLDDLGADRAYLAGMSWAGGAALELATWAPQRVAGLLLVSSGSSFTPVERAATSSAAGRWRASGGWRAFEVEQRALVAETGPLWDRLRPLPVPVTVVHGRRDRYIPLTAARLLAGRLGARLVEVDAGHVLHVEVPALLAAELVSLGSRA